MNVAFDPSVRKSMVLYLQRRVEDVAPWAEDGLSLPTDLSQALESIQEGNNPDLQHLKKVFENELKTIESTYSTSVPDATEDVDEWETSREAELETLRLFIHAVS